MSMGQLLLTAFIAMLVFGPKQLPTLARQLGVLIKRGNDYKQQLYAILEAQNQALQLQENMKKAADADKTYKRGDVI